MSILSVFYAHIEEAARQTGLSAAEICRRVRGFGFDAVEIDAKDLAERGETVLAALRAADLFVNCVYAFFDFGTASPETEAAEAARVLALCEKAEAKTLLAVAGFLSPDEMVRGSDPYEARRRRMAASLAMLVSRAEQCGITVVMEDFDSDTAPFSTAAELLWMLEHVPGLRCGFDTGNFLYSEERAEAVLPLFLPYIHAVHCKDRTFTENAGEKKATTADRVMYPVAVGGGCIPIRDMIQHLRRAGYNGAFAAEHFGAENQLAAMEASAVFLKKEILHA